MKQPYPNKSNMKSDLFSILTHGLIVSCQAPIDSPLHDPIVIAAMAKAAVNQGALGVRIDPQPMLKPCVNGFLSLLLGYGNNKFQGLMCILRHDLKMPLRSLTPGLI